MRGCDLRIILIAAVSQESIIAWNGTIPWQSSEEKKHFKRTTIGYPLIMGRKTWESLPGPLKDRINIVISRNKNYSTNSTVLIFNSLKESLEYCERESFEKCFIIGGGDVYRQAMELADEMIISEMKLKTEGDVLFPEIENAVWTDIRQENFDEFTIHTYIRKEKLNEKAFDTKN